MFGCACSEGHISVASSSDAFCFYIALNRLLVALGVQVPREAHICLKYLQFQRRWSPRYILLLSLTFRA